MDKVFSGMIFWFVLCYIDDVIVVLLIFEEYIKDFNEVF